MKICIVGYGRMGRNHKRVLTQMGHYVLTVDCDPHAGADLDGFHHPTDPDVYCVAVPIDQFTNYMALPCQYPVLFEKPAAPDLATLQQMHANGPLIVGYTERHNPAVQALKENLHRIGEIKHISARRLGYAHDRAGDPALDLATHDLDVIDHVFGGSLTLDHCARTEHHLSALLHHGETSISIEASHLHPLKTRTLEVVGTTGVLLLDYQLQTLHLQTMIGAVEEIAVDYAEPLVREWEAFFNGEGSDGIAAMTIAEQMAMPTELKAAA